MSQADFFNYYSIIFWFILLFLFLYSLNYIYFLPFIYSSLYIKLSYFLYFFNRIKNNFICLIKGNILFIYLKVLLNSLYLVIKLHIYVYA